MPGIGVPAAAVLLAETLGKTPATGAQPASYAGLAPVTRRSGSSIKGERRLPRRKQKTQESHAPIRLRLPQIRPHQPRLLPAQTRPRQTPGPSRPRPGPPPHPDPERHDPRRSPLRPPTSSTATHHRLTHHIGAPPGRQDRTRPPPPARGARAAPPATARARQERGVSAGGASRCPAAWAASFVRQYCRTTTSDRFAGSIGREAGDYAGRRQRCCQGRPGPG